MRLLVSIDNSTESMKAVNQALDLAEKLENNPEVVIAHCVDPVLAMNGNSYEEDLERATEIGEKAIEDATEVVDNRELGNIDVSTELLQVKDTVVNELSDFIESGEFDLVFMGHRNRTEREEKYVGSTTKKLISRSSVPVVAV